MKCFIIFYLNSLCQGTKEKKKKCVYVVNFLNTYIYVWSGNFLIFKYMPLLEQE